MNAPKSTLDELRIERKHAYRVTVEDQRWLAARGNFLIAVIAAAVWFTHT